MTSRAGLLDLIAAAVEAGWSLRRACGLLEVNHSRVPAGPDAVRRIIRLDYHTGDLTTAVSHTCTRTTSAGSARSPRRPARLARRVALAAAAAGRTPRPAARIDVPRLHWTPADLAPLADPRLQPFTIGHDLFGALVTLPTPGHTRGSLSLFVRRPAAAALLLVGDLTYDIRALERGIPGGVGVASAADTTSTRHATGCSGCVRPTPGWRFSPPHDPAADLLDAATATPTSPSA